MAVTVDALPASANQDTFFNNVATATFGAGSATVGLIPTASATALLVILIFSQGIGSDASAITVKWDGVTMSIITGTDSGNITTGSFDSHTILYQLTNSQLSGHTGSGKSAVATWTTSTNGYISAMSFAGTDLSTPFKNGTSTHNTSGTSTSVSATVTSPSGDMCVMASVSDGGSYTGTDSGTALYTDNGGANGNSAGNYMNGAGSTTLTQGVGATSWVASACDVQVPASADTLASSPGLLFMRRKSIGWTPLSDHRSRIFRPRPKLYLSRKTIMKAA